MIVEAADLATRESQQNKRNILTSQHILVACLQGIKVEVLSPGINVSLEILMITSN